MNETSLPTAASSDESRAIAFRDCAVERYYGEKHGTERRDRSGKKSSLRTNWKGFSQDHQDHVGWDCAGGQAQGQGLHLGAGKERLLEERGLIEEANYRACRGRRVVVVGPTASGEGCREALPYLTISSAIPNSARLVHIYRV